MFVYSCVRSISVDFSDKRLIRARESVGQFPEEVLLVHAVLEGFAAVDEDNRDFIGELAAQVFAGIDVYFAPGKAAAALELDQTFLDDFAKMAAFSGINHDLAVLRHGRSLRSEERRVGK